MTWAEFALPADALPAATAFLRAAIDAGGDGLFLRAEGRLVVQARGADHLVAPAPRGPATTVPLAGPVFSGPELGPATREVLAGVTPALLDLPADRAGLTALALDLMTAHLPAVSRPGAQGGPPLSFLSYRSHAEAFVVTSRDPAAARHALDSRYAAVRDTVEARVAGILRDGEIPAGARRWHDVAKAAKPGITELFRAGGIRAHTEYAGDHLRERDDFAGSRFHQIAGASADLQDYLGGDPGFLATRLLTSLLYLTLHSIGLSLADRYVLCHVVSRACESVYDVESVAVLSGIASAGLGENG
ncbi:lantibiotic dehydratase C-terminal domain-containing protein [Actinokineospora sp. UTMC 2448]|uniref:lantibiotic dehydratase C-terminal domain-containing protein n=1 Tax=Actinokineospora sp. UTMC 2448 TaxID=2268449 RepID=UPI002164CED7|nr:lantibiotic dehydratase C-terminal domain-containing protein [Actinokineospora sp. UTMC 2448]UVS78663.1 [4+2] cycloaddition enzyme PerO [Actinokineospora sp. UTMC 2448]